MQTRGVRGQKIPKNVNVICERPLKVPLKINPWPILYHLGWIKKTLGRPKKDDSEEPLCPKCFGENSPEHKCGNRQKLKNIGEALSPRSLGMMAADWMLQKASQKVDGVIEMVGSRGGGKHYIPAPGTSAQEPELTADVLIDLKRQLGLSERKIVATAQTLKNKSGTLLF